MCASNARFFYPIAPLTLYFYFAAPLLLIHIPSTTPPDFSLRLGSSSMKKSLIDLKMTFWLLCMHVVFSYRVIHRTTTRILISWVSCLSLWARHTSGANWLWRRCVQQMLYKNYSKRSIPYNITINLLLPFSLPSLLIKGNEHSCIQDRLFYTFIKKTLQIHKKWGNELPSKYSLYSVH